MKAFININDFETYIDDEALILSVCAEITYSVEETDTPRGVQLTKQITGLRIVSANAQNWDRVFERWQPCDIDSSMILELCPDISKELHRRGDCYGLAI